MLHGKKVAKQNSICSWQSRSLAITLAMDYRSRKELVDEPDCILNSQQEKTGLHLQSCVLSIISLNITYFTIGK